MDQLETERSESALISWLAAIREGISLRRSLDQAGYDRAGTTAPALLGRQLTLELDAYERMTEQLPLSEPLREALAAHVEDALRSDQAFLGRLLTRPDLGTLARAYLLERFRHDLRWSAVLVACLEGVRPPLPTAMAEADLERVSRTLTALEPEGPRYVEALRELSDRWDAPEPRLPGASRAERGRRADPRHRRRRRALGPPAPALPAPGAG